MLVSVVIPTHNRCSRVIRAVRSVLNQTYKEIEVIVVSDGSTDDTGKEFSALSQEEERLSFIEYHPNKGANYARNVGIKNAKGEYVAFLDDDDIWESEKLELQMEIFRTRPEVGLVYCHVDFIDEISGKVHTDEGTVSGDASKEILFGGFITTTSTVVMKKSVMEKAGFFDESLPCMQDYDMWIRMCQCAEVAIADKSLVKYYCNHTPGDTQIGKSTQQYIDTWHLLQKKYKLLFDKLSETEIKERDYIVYLGMAERALRNREAKQFGYCSRMALKSKFNFKVFVYCVFSLLPKDYSIYAFLRLQKMYKKLKGTNGNG